MSKSYVLEGRFENLVRSLVESGRFDSASDVVSEGLRLLERQERERAEEVAQLREAAEEGRRSGLSDEDGFEFLDRLAARYDAKKTAADN
ncbi:MAG: type II toxin-antitoxin system ParD family antitoxin [Alphaproteobacteria bacterium]